MASTILGVEPEELVVSIKRDLGPEKLAVSKIWGSNKWFETGEKLMGTMG